MKFKNYKNSQLWQFTDIKKWKYQILVFRKLNLDTNTFNIKGFRFQEFWFVKNSNLIDYKKHKTLKVWNFKELENLSQNIFSKTEILEFMEEIGKQPFNLFQDYKEDWKIFYKII